MKLDPSQQAAVELMLTASVGVVTGGPGTGKTTTTRAALDALEERGAVSLLAAPTGKASRRMEEATGRKAVTIHRLLGYLGPGMWAFTHESPLEADVVIVDEASMIDVELAAALFDAVRAPTRLILVGDADQLPSVGPGRVFGDLIDARACPVARLTTLHRAAAESWVCSQSPVILAGRVPDLSDRPDFRWVEHETRDRAVDALVRFVGGDVRANQRGGKAILSPTLRELGVEKQDEVQVLVPQNVGPAGADVINRRLQALLNPLVGPLQGRGDQRAWKLGGKKNGYELRLDDRVIQTRNDYDLDVMNGEIGAVVKLGAEELVVRFDAARSVTFTRKNVHGLRLAYALTVHKYQGSEIPWAVVLCHSTHTRMLERTLLYTAVTRAKQGVVLFGDRPGIGRAVKNARATKRFTGLADRLRAGAAEAGEQRG